jgi:hypothetical protein
MAKSNLALKHSSNLKSDIYDINTLSDEYRRFICSLADAIKRLSDEETIRELAIQLHEHARLLYADVSIFAEKFGIFLPSLREKMIERGMRLVSDDCHEIRALPKDEKTCIYDLDALSQCYCDDMRALGKAIERLSSDETIKNLGGQANTRADMWCNDINCFAESYGANYRADEVDHG